MEERKSKLESLRSHLMQGAEQAKAGQFVDGFSMDSLINDLDREA
jgi:antitoxin ParD1/3/4